ncbi:MAG TPA: SAM-dependent methyltransferase [Streptosporangiaceae bacterium]|nr:SAM-dependent methyltransferase [Streptosporangiaceae bacterium]
MADDLRVPPGVDPGTPSPARLYDYYLGGTNNFEADRLAAEKITALIPELQDMAWANRGFHQRAVRWLAAEQGIRQFLDVGSGLPTVGNTHEVAQKVNPDARVVYVDNDPMAIAHAGDLLAGSRNTAVIQADMRDPDSVLKDPRARELIDFDEPVALVITAVLHFIADGSDPWGLVAHFMDALAPGSHLVLSHGTSDGIPPQSIAAFLAVYENASERGYARTRAEIERFFDGLELVPPWPGAAPAVVHVGEWGAEDLALADSDGSRWSYCGVARRP